LLDTTTYDELLTTAPFRRNFVESEAKYVVDVLYDNQDNSNIAQMRAVEDGILKPVPPASLGHIFNETRKYVEIIPDTSTGSGVLVVTLASKEELKRVGLL